MIQLLPDQILYPQEIVGSGGLKTESDGTQSPCK